MQRRTVYKHSCFEKCAQTETTCFLFWIIRHINCEVKGNLSLLPGSMEMSETSDLRKENQFVASYLITFYLLFGRF